MTIEVRSEPAHEVEEQLPAGLGEGQVAEVEDDEVAPGELVRGAALASSGSRPRGD